MKIPTEGYFRYDGTHITIHLKRIHISFKYGRTSLINSKVKTYIASTTCANIILYTLSYLHVYTDNINIIMCLPSTFSL